MNDEVRYVGDVQRMELKPGDVIVFSSDRPCPRPDVERIEDWLRVKFPGHEVVVIWGGNKIGVMGA